MYVRVSPDREISSILSWEWGPDGAARAGHAIYPLRVAFRRITLSSELMGNSMGEQNLHHFQTHMAPFIHIKMWSVTRFALLEKGQSNHTFWGYACMKYCFLSCVISFLYRWICLLMRFIIGLCMSSHLYVVFCRWHKKLAELPLNPVLHKSMSFHKVLYLQWASSFACMYTIWRAPAAIPSTELNEHWPPTAALMRECPQMESACSKNDNVDLLCKWSYLKLQLLVFLPWWDIHLQITF